MSFRLVSKSVTLSDLERRNGRYFALFQRIRVASGAHCMRKSSRSLSHLLVSSCYFLANVNFRYMLSPVCPSVCRLSICL